jgi:hypothetical protein
MDDSLTMVGTRTNNPKQPGRVTAAQGLEVQGLCLVQNAVFDRVKDVLLRCKKRREKPFRWCTQKSQASGK